MNERILYKHCPLCESVNFKTTREGNCSGHNLYKPGMDKKIIWKTCSDCSHVFTNGYYSDKAAKAIFSDTQEYQIVGDGLEKNRFVSAKMIEKVLPYKQSGVWLDVGFGNGSLLFTALEFGFKPIGLDLRAQTVKAMKEVGVEAYCKDICDFEYAGEISVISMADVLEHTPFPKKVLQAARKLIEADGVLFLSMPNSESVLWTTASKRNINPFWDELEHYHNFGRTRLYSLLEETGFSPVKFGISERYRMCMEIIARP